MDEQSPLASRAVEFSGGCLCRGVRFESVGLRDIVYCHCEQCRRFHGTVAAYTATQKSRLHIKHDASLRWFAASKRARRGYCTECGSALFWSPRERPFICIAAGALDGGTALHAARHIFVADKANYYDINDQLLRFAGSMLTE